MDFIDRAIESRNIVINIIPQTSDIIDVSVQTACIMIAVSFYRIISPLPASPSIVTIILPLYPGPSKLFRTPSLC